MKKLFRVFVLIWVIGCVSEDNNTVYEPDPTQEEPTEPTPTPGDIVIADNVVSIRDAESDIISSEEELASGLYRIQFNGTPPGIELNDVIVGGEGYGFIRRVTEVSVNGNVATLMTTQASLEDVFESGTVTFTFGQATGKNIQDAGKSLNTNPDYTSKESVNINLADFDFGPYFKLNKGVVTLDQSLGPIVAEFKDSELQAMDFQNNSLVMTTELDFDLGCPGAVDYVQIVNADPEEYEYPQSILGLDFKVVVSIQFVSDLSIFSDRSFQMSGDVVNTVVAPFGAENSNSAWNGVDRTLTVDTRTKGVSMEKPANVQQKFLAIARTEVRLNGWVAPYAQVDASEAFFVNYDEGGKNWDAALSAGLDFNFGVYGSILGIDYDFSADPVILRDQLWYGPANILIESGDDQKAVYYGPGNTEPLPEPLKIRVVDSFQEPLSNVMAHYEVISGDGSLEIPDVPTTAGIAENQWTLGGEGENQIVEVSINTASGALIGDSPVEFNAEMIDLSGVWIIENASSNCPEGVFYRFSFNPDNSIGFPGGGYPEIVSAGYTFDLEEKTLSMGITSKEVFEYICEVDNQFYVTEETGSLELEGLYGGSGLFTGNFTVSFTELPVNPCVYNFSCTDSFVMYKE